MQQGFGAGMGRFLVSLAAVLAFAGAAHAQTDVVTPKKAPVVQKAATTQVVHPPAAKPATTPQTLRGTRYGGFAPSIPAAPPELDTTSPRSLSLLNVNTKEELTVTYWSDGTYHRDALDQLNHFLRDSQNGQQTEMDPLLFDVLWHTMNVTGYHGTVEVLSAYRSPDQCVARVGQPRRGARQPA